MRNTRCQKQRMSTEEIRETQPIAMVSCEQASNKQKLHSSSSGIAFHKKKEA